MFGKSKTDPAEELYTEQKSRNGSYGQTYEYRTIMEGSIEAFDVALNAQAQSGWELLGFQVVSSSAGRLVFGSLRRPRNP